jgi:hypothetical protein
LPKPSGDFCAAVCQKQAPVHRPLLKVCALSPVLRVHYDVGDNATGHSSKKILVVRANQMVAARRLS